MYSDGHLGPERGYNLFNGRLFIGAFERLSGAREMPFVVDTVTILYNFMINQIVCK